MAGNIDSPKGSGRGIIDGPGNTPYRPAPLNPPRNYDQGIPNPGFAFFPNLLLPSEQLRTTNPMPGQASFPPV